MSIRGLFFCILMLLPTVTLAKTNLHHLVIAGDTQAVASLLPDKKISKLDKRGNAPIHYAAAGANAEMTALLLSHGADANTLNKKYRTSPLHEVARSTNKNASDIRETTGILISHGANPWAIDKHGETPFQAAARIGNAAFVDQILANNVIDADIQEDALLLAREFSRYSVIRLLETHGVQSDKGKNRGLLAAVELGDFATVDSLVRSGADLDATLESGATPLILAAENDHDELVELLIAHGADVNTQTNEGKAALHAAAGHGNRVTVNTLVTNHANVNINSPVYGTPVNAAAKKEQVTIVNLLIAAGGEPARVDGNAEDLFGSGLGWLLFAEYHESNSTPESTRVRRETATEFLSSAKIGFEEELELTRKLQRKKKRGEAIADALAIAVVTAAAVGFEKLRQDQVRSNQRQTARIRALGDARSYDDYHRRVRFYEGAMINPTASQPYQIDFNNTSLTNKESISGLDVAISEYERRIALTQKLLEGSTNDEAAQKTQAN